MSETQKIILPGTDSLLLSPAAAQSQLTDTNARIHERVLRLLKIAGSRGCPVVRKCVDQFTEAMEALVPDESDPFTYLDDPFLRGLAVQGEQHLCPNYPVLPGLFAKRVELMAVLAAQ